MICLHKDLSISVRTLASKFHVFPSLPLQQLSASSWFLYQPAPAFFSVTLIEEPTVCLPPPLSSWSCPVQWVASSFHSWWFLFAHHSDPWNGKALLCDQPIRIWWWQGFQSWSHGCWCSSPRSFPSNPSQSVVWCPYLFFVWPNIYVLVKEMRYQ